MMALVTRTLILAALVAVVLAPGVDARSPSTNTRIVHALRAARGDAIRTSVELRDNARSRARYMLRHGFDQHRGAGAIRADRWRLWGEVVAWRSRGLNAEWAVRAWLRSPTHRSVILGRWDAVGVSCARSGRELWCVAVFGDRRP